MMFSPVRIKIAAIFSLLILSSCVVGPDYKRPPVIIAPEFKEAQGKEIIEQNKNLWKVADPRDDIGRGEWWRIFNDPVLNNLEVELNIANQTIAAALANFYQSLALVDEARAAYFPTINFNANFTRQRESFGNGSGSSFSNLSQTGQQAANTSGIGSGSTSNSTGTGTGTGTGGATRNAITFNTYSAIINGSWQPDLWGLVHRTVEASKAFAQSDAALLANTQLSAQGSLAQYYFELRALDMDQKILDDTVRSYKKSLQLTRNQYKSGVASQGDILQALAQLQAAEATAIQNGINRAIYEHAIAVLIGQPPASFALAPNPLRQTPPPIPLFITSELLERRPDIAQAERLMAQANAQIGIALTAYFPTITLTGNLNREGLNGLSHLFNINQLGWAYGAQLVQIIFNGGLTAATVRAARAGYASTVATYRQTVLAAFQNVEDNLSTLRILAKEGRVQNAAVITAKKALKFVINEYKAGTVDYASVITAQITAFTAEKNAADIVGLRMTAAVGLIMSLGGGWDTQHLIPSPP